MPLFTSPFLKLNMSLHEKEQLHATSMELLDQARIRYERYAGEDKRRIDSARWSLVKEREGISVYHDQRLRLGATNKDMHSLLTVGTLVGKLDDAMYGELNHTSETMRIKTAYMKDTMVDCAVLETIQEPTADEPFQSLTVRWFVKGVSPFLRLVTKHHDMVFLEASGISQLSNGESVGYHIKHSLSSPKTPKLSQYVRSNMSICMIWHQVDAKRVQVYSVSHFEIVEGSLVLPIALKSIAEALLSSQNVIECAQLKKLTSLVQRKAALIRERETTSGHYDKGCTVCGSQSQSARKGIQSCCAICGTTTCNSCRQKREIFVISPDRQLLPLKMRFCLPCITSTSLLDSVAVARDELSGAGKPQPSSSSSFLMLPGLSHMASSSSSSSSGAFLSHRSDSVISSTSS